MRVEHLSLIQLMEAALVEDSDSKSLETSNYLQVISCLCKLPKTTFRKERHNFFREMMLTVYGFKDIILYFQAFPVYCRSEQDDALQTFLI